MPTSVSHPGISIDDSVDSFGGMQGMLAMENQTAFLFDLDGTLLDAVYQHVLA